MAMTMDEQAGERIRWKPVVLWSAAILLAIAAGVFAYLNTDVFFPSRPDTPIPLSRLVLKAQFMGPLKDTVVQRWDDPATHASCYIYLPVVVQHSHPTPTGFVQYGSNGIGTISCVRS